jgi:hypothetical protein
VARSPRQSDGRLCLLYPTLVPSFVSWWAYCRQHGTDDEASCSSCSCCVPSLGSSRLLDACFMRARTASADAAAGRMGARRGGAPLARRLRAWRPYTRRQRTLFFRRGLLASSHHNICADHLAALSVLLGSRRRTVSAVEAAAPRAKTRGGKRLGRAQRAFLRGQTRARVTALAAR